jgi:hypothetical protein
MARVCSPCANLDCCLCAPSVFTSVDAILQKTRPQAKGAPKKKTKAEQAKHAEEKRKAERQAFLNGS